MKGDAARVLVLDHRDSFVFTLVDHFARLGAAVRTLRTGVSLEQLRAELSAFDPDLVLLSPGRRIFENSTQNRTGHKGQSPYFAGRQRKGC